jgi:hypothetical protein
MEELARYEPVGMELSRKPSEVLSQAKEAATALKGVIAGKAKPVIIQGEQYLEFEDWQTVGRFYGVTAKVVSTAPIDLGGVQGFEARAVVLRNADGMELSAADSMCLNDEANWKNRPLFMLRSMAQTRACAKALRNVLAWVVVLAGYRPTPAEEMQGVGEKKPPLQDPQKKANGQAAPAPGFLTSPILKAETVEYAKKDKAGKPTGDKGKFYKITVHDENGNESSLSSFSDTLFLEAQKEAGTNDMVKIGWKPGRKEGTREFTSIDRIEPGPDENAQ